MSRTDLRVLVACQGHARLDADDGARAAMALFEELNARPDCVAWLLGCQSGRLELKSPLAQPFGGREYLYTPRATDGFMFANRDEMFPGELAALVAALGPDVVHFHGFSGLGIEAIDIVRRAAPRARIVLTLHDYGAICANAGQMVTRPGRQLCHEASPPACARCFPERGQADFYLRNVYLRRFLDQVDQFVVPTSFLRERHIAWGLPAARIAVIAAFDDAGAPDRTASPRAADGMLRIGYFGEMSPGGGLGVLLAAARLLESKSDIAFEIHGDPRAAPPEVHDEVAELLAGATGNVRVFGAPAAGQLDRLVRGVDAVAVPSIRWEGAPAAIADALRNRRPVICSDIGGMAELVRDCIDGFHVPPGDAVTLARVVERLAALPQRLHDLTAGLRQPVLPADIAEQYVAVYRHVGGTAH